MRDPFQALIDRARNTPQPERVQGNLQAKPVSAKQVRAEARERERVVASIAAASLSTRAQGTTQNQVIKSAIAAADEIINSIKAQETDQ